MAVDQKVERVDVRRDEKRERVRVLGCNDGRWSCCKKNEEEKNRGGVEENPEKLKAAELIGPAQL
jgi:hypothetical protein